jgi:hypothetical protein
MSDLIKRLRSEADYAIARVAAIQNRGYLGDAKALQDLGDAALEAADALEAANARIAELEALLVKANDSWLAMSSIAANGSDSARHAERYRWLASRFVGADFDWNEQGVKVLCFEIDGDFRVSADVGASIDAAKEKTNV